MPIILRALIIIICGLVLISLAPVIIANFHGTQPCPALGLVPACYVVGFCYVLIALSAIRLSNALFWIGLGPVFGLAFLGSTLELSGVPTCPQSSSGIPMCYISLAIVTLLLALFIFAKRLEKAARP
jgi:hypothetical protein